MSATIKVFQVGEKCFTHFMNTRDDSIELRDEDGGVLLRYDESAHVNDHNGRMGHLPFERFEDRMRWVYYEIARQTVTPLGADLPSAEVEVSRLYIDRSGGAR